MAPDPWHDRPVLAALARRWSGLGWASPPDRRTLQGWLDDAGGPWSLVDGAAGSRSYEEAVAEGSIPTRPGSWHDVFNVLAFVRFPRAKAALHRRVLALQRARRLQGVSRRTREEDALTLLDEAVIVVCGAATRLARFDRARHAADLAAMEAEVFDGPLRVVCFGHALLEHLVLQRPPIGAGVLLLPDPTLDVDAVLTRHIEAQALVEPRFAPTLDWPEARLEHWVSTTD